MQRCGRRKSVVQHGGPVSANPTTQPPPPPTPCAHKSVLELANPAWTQSVHRDAPGHRHGPQPVSGTADPRSSQTGQVIQGLR